MWKLNLKIQSELKLIWCAFLQKIFSIIFCCFMRTFFYKKNYWNVFTSIGGYCVKNWIANWHGYLLWGKGAMHKMHHEKILSYFWKKNSMSYLCNWIYTENHRNGSSFSHFAYLLVTCFCTCNTCKLFFLRIMIWLTKMSARFWIIIPNYVLVPLKYYWSSSTLTNI